MRFELKSLCFELFIQRFYKIIIIKLIIGQSTHGRKNRRNGSEPNMEPPLSTKRDGYLIYDSTLNLSGDFAK